MNIENCTHRNTNLNKQIPAHEDNIISAVVFPSLCGVEAAHKMWILF